MKDSGIPWIGEIPNHWRKELIGSCIKEVNNPNTDNAEDNALQFKMGTIISKKGGDSKYNPETLEAYNKVRQGDIIINGLNLSFDFISQRVGLVKEDGVITSTYLALRPLSIIDSRFLNYLFKGYDYCKALHSMGRGLRATLGYNEFRKYSVIFPSISEQQAITDFLDKKCSEIDEMLSLQEKIIEELKAYKQSVISEAVCQGLNLNVPMKDSGIEGVIIPHQWSSRKFNQLCSRITDFVASGSFAALRENVPYLDTPDYAMLVRTADLSNNARSEGRVYISKQSYDFLRNSNLYGGEIVLPNIGSIGDVYIVPKDLYPKMSLAPNAITFSTLQNDKYYYYYFLGALGKKQLHDIAESTAMPKFNKTDLKQLKVLCPPINEQQSIADYLDAKCGEIDALISLKQSKIDALKEYKKSIIYEYVTGKKEVTL